MPKSTKPQPKPRKVSKKCKCGAPSTKLHNCSYDVEMSVGEDHPDIKQCNCCPECTAKCREEV